MLRVPLILTAAMVAGFTTGHFSDLETGRQPVRTELASLNPGDMLTPLEVNRAAKGDRLVPAAIAPATTVSDDSAELFVPGGVNRLSYDATQVPAAMFQIDPINRMTIFPKTSAGITPTTTPVSMVTPVAPAAVLPAATKTGAAEPQQTGKKAPTTTTRMPIGCEASTSPYSSPGIPTSISRCVS